MRLQLDVVHARHTEVQQRRKPREGGETSTGRRLARRLPRRVAYLRSSATRLVSTRSISWASSCWPTSADKGRNAASQPEEAALGIRSLPEKGIAIHMT